MITADNKNKYVKQREQLHNQIKMTDNENLKNQYRLQIEDSKVKQAEEQAEKRKKQRDLKKQEIKEEYYLLNKRTINLYRKLGLIKSNRQINERLNKSNSFLQSCEVQKHFPKLDTLSDLIFDIENIISNIDYLIDDMFSKESIVRALEQLQERYKQLKIKILTEYYMS
jgi:hypothetical protein